MQDDWMTADAPRVLKARVHALAGERRKLAGGLLLLCCPTALYAAEISFDPAAAATLGYESNAALTTGPHDAASYFAFSPGLTIRSTTETSAINLRLLASATNYTGNEFEDTNEAQVALSSFVQSTERTRLGLDAEARWDSLFESAVLGTGTGDIQDVDIGLTTTKVRRNYRELLPSVGYALTERSWVTFRYRLTDVLFDDVGATGLVDYQQHFLSGTYSHRLTDVNNLNVVVQGSQYRPVAGTDSDTVGLLAGISHTFSPTADAGFLAGFNKTTETVADGSQVDTSSFTLEARATQRAELSQLEGIISRDVQPSGIGKSVATDQLRVYWNRYLSPITAFFLQTTVFRINALEGSDPLDDRRYAEAEAGLGWHWMPEWSFRVAYKYRNQKYDADPDSAQSSGVSATLAWAPPRR
jgi:hypothetical protein